MLEKLILKLVGPLFAFVSSSFNRYRLKGFRVQIICAVISDSGDGEMLLVKSRYENAWMLPQEGVNQNEDLEDAIWRCLSAECGIDIPDDKIVRNRRFHVRGRKFVGALKLPSRRHGNRQVVDNAAGTAYERIKMIGKAYWIAAILVGDKSELHVSPNQIEVVETNWTSVSHAMNLIESSNRPEKAALLTDAIRMLKRELHLGG